MAYGDLKVRNLIWNTGSGDNTVVLSTLATQSYVTTNFAPKNAPAFTGSATGVNLTLSGNLTVNGTQTIINTQTLDVEDKQIEIGKVSSPSDTTANEGGIKLKGASDKTILWYDSTDAWTFNQNIEIASSTPSIKLKDGNGRNVEIIGGSASTGPEIRTAYTADLRFGTNSLERMRISSSGLILVGHHTNVADSRLQVIGVDENTSSQSLLRFSNSASSSVLNFYKSRNAGAGVNTVVQNNDTVGVIRFKGADGTDYSQVADIQAAIDGTPGNNDTPGRLSFSTTADGAQYTSERLRISSTGAFGIAGANYGSSGQVLTSGGSGAAPSWTTISAAPEITATADGAIAANKPVRLNEDGTISEIKNTALSAATGSNTDIPHAYDPSVKAAVWISTTKFVLFWIATGSGNDRLQAAVGTASGTSITYGSKVEISTDNDVHRVSAVYDSSIDVILLTYCPNNSGNGGNGYIKGLTVSGTTITVNSTGQSNGDASHTVDIASDGKGGFVQQWVNKDGQWYGLAGTVTTAGAISKGSNVHIANSRSTQLAYNTMRICYDSDKDVFVSICRFNNNIDYSICTRSGTIMTETSASTPPTIISGTQNSNVNIVYVKSELRFFIVGRSSSSPYSLKYATPKMNTAGTALDTGGSGTLFAGKQDYMGFTAYDEGVNKIFHTFADDTSGQQDTKLLTITLNSSGTTTGTGSVTSEQLASHKEENGQAIACNGAGLVLTGVDKADDSDVLSRLKQLATTVSNLNGDSFIGFSSAAISDSASGTVGVVGNTATQSGLTPSKKYYVQKGGTVSTAADDPSVVAGIALSSTKLLIKG